MDFSFRRCKTPKLCLGRKLSKKDRISGLPDDILVCVLSLLTMKEAGKTSLLSKRWRHVWAHVVSSHKAFTVDEFRVRFYLYDTSSDNINKWVVFAVEKRVKRLELDFGNYEGLGGYYLYNFPSLSFCNSLASLQLAFVNVIGEVLESLIYNCKALEILSVIESQLLVDLKVVGPSLKSLRIFRCLELINLEVFAPNLVYMDYNGRELCMPFKSTPKLAELAIGGIVEPHLMMSFITHQIEVLKFSIPKIKPFSKVFPKCTRLKMLDVSCSPECGKDLFRLSSLIKACPLLQKLVLQLYLSNLKSYKKKWKSKVEEPWCHNHLKIVEIVGFAGSALRFARYLVKNVVSLEKMIIDTQPVFDLRIPGEPEVGETIARARKQAKRLRANLKPWTKLEIR